MHARGTRPAKHARAYIMMEAMFGGALVATAVLSAFAAVGQVRAESILQAREMVARDVALQQLEIARAGGFGSSVGCPTSPGEGTVVTGNPFQPAGIAPPARYDVVVSRRCVMERVTTAVALDIRYKLVTATVTFHTFLGDKTVSASTRIYDR